MNPGKCMSMRTIDPEEFDKLVAKLARYENALKSIRRGSEAGIVDAKWCEEIAREALEEGEK